MPTPEPRRRPTRAMPARLHAARRHARLGVLHLVDDALTVLQKRRAFERQRDLARRAHEQLHAEPLFQRIEPPSDHRRRDAFCLRRRKTALRGNRGEGFDLLESIHAGLSSIAKPADRLGK